MERLIIFYDYPVAFCVAESIYRRVCGINQNPACRLKLAQDCKSNCPTLVGFRQ